MERSKIIRVSAIKEGTVIDHIPAGRGLILAKFLKLSEHKKIVTLGLNFRSRRLGQKDIIKIEGKALDPQEVNQVAILAPSATLNIIRNFQVVKKIKLKIPKIVEGIVACPNPACITNSEEVITKFYPQIFKKKIRLTCHYCEKIFSENELAQFNS